MKNIRFSQKLKSPQGAFGHFVQIRQLTVALIHLAPSSLEAPFMIQLNFRRSLKSCVKSAPLLRGSSILRQRQRQPPCCGCGIPQRSVAGCWRGKNKMAANLHAYLIEYTKCCQQLSKASYFRSPYIFGKMSVCDNQRYNQPSCCTTSIYVLFLNRLQHNCVR